jgi:hypothetical protein
LNGYPMRNMWRAGIPNARISLQGWPPGQILTKEVEAGDEE